MTWRTGLVLFASAVVCGCSDKESTYEVTGKVTMANGTPLSGGTVVFQPETTGQPGAKGQIQSDGSYEMGTYKADDGVVLGTHRVLVVPQAPPNWNIDKQGLPPDLFDPKYRSLDTSGLTCEVKDDMEYNITLEEAPPPPLPEKPKRGVRRR